MRIYYVSLFSSWCATSWRRVLELGKSVSRFHEVSFVCPSNAIPRLQSMTADVSVNIIPATFWINNYLGRGLARTLAIGQCDIIHTFKPYPDIFLPGLISKLKGTTWICDFDDLEGGEGYNRNAILPKRKAMDFFEWMVPRLADRVTVASEGLRRFYNKHDPFYIPNGADPDLFHPSRHRNRKPVIAYMGVFHKNMVDVDMAIYAAANVAEKTDIHLVLIGDGPERRRVEMLTKKFNIDAIFTGYIEDVASVVASADIGVIPFRDNQLNQCKCPLRLFEFMACGLPIVATKVGEPAHVLKDGLGVLVAPDVKSISSGILSLLENPSLASMLGEKSRKRVEETFNWDKLGNRLAQFYEKVKTRSERERGT